MDGNMILVLPVIVPVLAGVLVLVGKVFRKGNFFLIFPGKIGNDRTGCTGGQVLGKRFCKSFLLYVKKDHVPVRLDIGIILLPPVRSHPESQVDGQPIKIKETFSRILR